MADEFTGLSIIYLVFVVVYGMVGGGLKVALNSSIIIVNIFEKIEIIKSWIFLIEFEVFNKKKKYYSHSYLFDVFILMKRK